MQVWAKGDLSGRETQSLLLDTNAMLLFQGTLNLFLHFLSQLLHLPHGDRTFIAGLLNPGDDLAAVVRRPTAVLFHDGKLYRFFHSFVGREPSPTTQTQPPPPYDAAALARTRIDNLILILFAKRATHKCFIPKKLYYPLTKP